MRRDDQGRFRTSTDQEKVEDRRIGYEMGREIGRRALQKALEDPKHRETWEAFQNWPFGIRKE